jgi:ATP-binding cassette, subfamily C, bacterial
LEKKENYLGGFRMILDFMRYQPWRSSFILICMVFSGLSEGIGVGTLLPLLNLAGSGNPEEGSLISELTGRAFHSLGFNPGLGILLCLIVAGIVLKGVFRLIAMKQVGYSVARAVTNLRLALFKALMRVRWNYFITHPVGLLTNAVSSEAIRISWGYKLMFLIIAEAIQVVFYLSVAMLISWSVTLASLIMGLLIASLFIPLLKIANRAGASQTGSLQAILVRMTDLLCGIKSIKAMGQENLVGSFLEEESEELNSALEQQVLSTEILKCLHEPVLVFFMGIGLYVVLTGWDVPVTNLLVMAFLFHRSVTIMGKVQKQYQAMKIYESAYWSFRDTLNQAKSANEETSGKSPADMRHGVIFKNVSFSYNAKKVLNEVDLTIPFGKITVVTGESGSGKTTLVDLLAGLIRPQAGEIIVDGVALSAIDLRSWRKLLGYLPQETFLFNESVVSNVTLGDKSYTRRNVEEALSKAGALDFVISMPDGMDTVIGERAGTISGGQRQRIALAKTLIRKPRLLILDEMTMALDPKTEAAICKTLIELRGEMAIFAVSHQRALIEAADFVFRVEDGKINLVES